MDPIARMVAAGAAGAAGAGEGLYVDEVFSTFLYEGNSSTQTINNGIDLSGEGGLVWFATRSGTGLGYVLQDTERGNTKYLRSHDTGQEATSTSMISSFNSNGFAIGSDTNINYTGDKEVSWTFRKAPGFFDVVTWTGDGTSGRTIAHNLGSVPGMIFVKVLNDSDNWHVYHRSLGATKYLNLNTTSAASTASSRWNDTEPTSTVFTVANTSTNANGKTYVAYLFAHDDQSFGTNSDEAIIKCGSYTGTGSAYNEIDLGFEPQLVFFKNASNSVSWYIMDTMRGLTADGSLDEYIFPDQPYAAGSTGFMYPTSTGFGFTATGAGANASGDTYIYMAIRRPHKSPTAGTDVFKAVQTTSQPVSVGFPTDLIVTAETGSGDKYWVPRLTEARLQSTDTSAENDVSSYFQFDLQNSFSTGSFYGSLQSINWYFRRAPGFFDVVAYTGTGSQQTISHNLGATPELFILKDRDGGSASWWVWAPSAISTSQVLLLYSSNALSNNGNLTQINSSSWTTNTNSGGANTSGNKFIAYLFASLDGISKVGSYSGTGSNIDVDCGFTAGARFVLIKRTDSGGHWYVWDTTRGIVSGNDPYILLSTSAAQTTNTDYIDPLNAGFTVTSSAPAALNTSGGTYLFLAIA